MAIGMPPYDDRTLRTDPVLLLPSPTYGDATVELSKALSDATTPLTNGTSGAANECLDPLNEFTSSTTPRSLADSPLLGANLKALVFTMWTHGNIRADIARDPGEYLASLATLTGISATIGPNFRTV